MRGIPSEEEEVDSWDRYSGITLLDSNTDELEDDILEIVILAFAADDVVEVLAMEHPHG